MLPNVFRLGPWRVLRDQNRLERIGGGAPSERIEPKAMDVLCVLAAHAGQTVTRETLLDQVWSGRLVVEAALSRIILALRTSLGDDARAPTFIETVPKRGYRLLVTPLADSDAPGSAVAGGVVQHVPLAPAADAIVAPVPATRAHRTFGVWLLPVAIVALGAVTWALWPRIQLERAISDGIDAMKHRGEAPADRAVLREELGWMRSGRVLWVDDEPAGNTREITTLEKAGLVVDVASSNNAAAEQMRGREYDLLISDIRRPPPEATYAGLELPRQVVPDRNRLPPIVYYAHFVSAPRTADGYPVTNKASELFRLVSDVFRWRQTNPQIRPLERPVTAEAAPR